MTEIDRSQFYSGGFFLVRAGHQNWEHLGIDIPKVISLSRCLCKRFELSWNRQIINPSSILEFGIDESKLEQFEEWVDNHWFKEIEIGGMFNSIEGIRKFISEFISKTDDLYLIEVGLERDNVTWLNHISDNSICTASRILAKTPMLQHRMTLGYEVLSYEYYDFSHSWLCSGLTIDMFDLYGIETNQYGLISDYNDAKKVYEWIAEDNMRGRRGEPEPYDFWLLVSHPLEEAPQG